MLHGKYKKPKKLTIPLVTDLHHTIAYLLKFMMGIKEATGYDTMINILIPKDSLIVSYRRLPHLTVKS